MAMGVTGEILSVMGTGRPGAFRLVGEIDMSSAAGLAGILTEEQEKGPELILDLSQVTFMDSNGLQVLLDLAASHPVVVTRPSKPVTRLFEVAIPHGAPGLRIRT